MQIDFDHSKFGERMGERATLFRPALFRHGNAGVVDDFVHFTLISLHCCCVWELQRGGLVHTRQAGQPAFRELQTGASDPRTLKSEDICEANGRNSARQASEEHKILDTLYPTDTYLLNITI